MIVKTIIESIIILYMSVIFHELGHYYTLKRFKPKKASIIYNWRGLYVSDGEKYKGLTREDKLAVYNSGIISGFMFIVLFSLLNPYYAFTIVPYIYGAREDIKKGLILNKTPPIQLK